MEEEIRHWIQQINDETILPSDIVAFNFGLFESEEGYCIYLTGSKFYDESDDERRFLISESVRGEGGKLYNINGERFVDELQPRDVVSQAIFKEMEKTNSPYVLLDISFLDENYLKNRFSTIYNKCLKKGTDITKAHGQEITSISKALYNHVLKFPPKIVGIITIKTASKTTIGV